MWLVLESRGKFTLFLLPQSVCYTITMKKPLLHALLAVLYIIIVVLGVNFTSQIEQKETILIPMVMLSLFVFSVAVMGFLFLSEPLQLLIEKRKQEAVVFFVRTLGFFALFAIILGIVYFLN